MLSWSISSAILILLVMALRAVIKDRVSPRLRYALWLLVLVRLLVPVSLGSTPISVLNAVETAETAVRGEVQVDSGLTAPVYPATSAGEDLAPQTPVTSLPEPDQSAPGAPVDTDAPREPVRAADILLVLWAVGAAVTATVLVSMNLRFYEGLKRRGKLLGQFRGLPVYTAEGLMSPCLAGVLRPAVFIDPELARHAVARTHILAHEYTHYRQRDHIWCALRCVCLALHWYDPLVWWAAAVSRRDCELSCDAGAVALLGEEARASYGRTLVSMVAGRAAPAELLRCATTMAGGKSAVKERVALLVKDPRTRATTLCVVAALLLVMAGCTFTGAMADKEDGLQALEDGFAAFEAAAESGDTFTAALSHRGDVVWEADDLYQFTDWEAVLTLVERMRRCTWTYEGEYHGQDMWEQMGDMCLLFQSGRTGFTFYTGTGGTLVNYTVFAEDSAPTIRYYRAELPEDLRGQYDDPYDLFYETYLATCLANGGTPAGTDAPEYGFTTTTSQESIPSEDGTELAYYDLSYPMAYVANEDALDGDTLAAARTVVQTFNGEMERRMEANKAALAGYTERLEGPVIEPWYVRVSSTVSVQGRLASATMLLEDFTGGAHPNYGYDSALFDLGAGQFIEPQSLGADPDAFTAGAAEVLIAYADGFDASFHADAWGDWQDTVRDWPRTGSASFLEDGLHVYFDPYALGPYSMGGVELFASYGDLWALFSDSGREKLGLAGSGMQGDPPDQSVDGSTGDGQPAAPQDPRADMLAAYAGILELAFSGEPSPDDYFNYYDPAVTGRAELAQDRFAVCDVDGDGADELIIDYTTTYTPGMNVAVYGYDAATGEVRQELRDYRAATFYDNGYATVDASHDHGRNALDGDWWPYSLYRYDRETDTYQLAAVVDAWNREQAESVEDQLFPAEADADGDGVVYYAGADWDYRDPMDGGEYRKWVSSWQAGAEELDIPWRDLTWDNAHTLQ